MKGQAMSDIRRIDIHKAIVRQAGEKDETFYVIDLNIEPAGQEPKRDSMFISDKDELLEIIKDKLDDLFIVEYKRGGNTIS